MLLGTELTGPVELAFALLISLAASIVLGTVGFGFGLVSSPPMLLFLEAKTTIVIVNSLTAIMAGLILLTTWRHLDLRRSKGLIIGGLAGTPVGVLLLNVAEPESPPHRNRGGDRGYGPAQPAGNPPALRHLSRFGAVLRIHHHLRRHCHHHRRSHRRGVCRRPALAGPRRCGPVWQPHS